MERPSVQRDYFHQLYRLNQELRVGGLEKSKAYLPDQQPPCLSVLP